MQDPFATPTPLTTASVVQDLCPSCSDFALTKYFVDGLPRMGIILFFIPLVVYLFSLLTSTRGAGSVTQTNGVSFRNIALVGMLALLGTALFIYIFYAPSITITGI